MTKTNRGRSFIQGIVSHGSIDDPPSPRSAVSPPGGNPMQHIDGNPDRRRWLRLILSRALACVAITTTAALLAHQWWDVDFTSGRVLPVTEGDWLFYALSALVLAPVLENLLVLAVIRFGERVLPVGAADAIAVILIACAHGVFNLAWGLNAALAFVFVVNAYRCEANVSGYRSGYWVSVAVHALINAIVLIALAVWP